MRFGGNWTPQSSVENMTGCLGIDIHLIFLNELQHISAPIKFLKARPLTLAEGSRRKSNSYIYMCVLYMYIYIYMSLGTQSPWQRMSKGCTIISSARYLGSIAILRR